MSMVNYKIYGSKILSLMEFLSLLNFSMGLFVNLKFSRYLVGFVSKLFDIYLK